MSDIPPMSIFFDYVGFRRAAFHCFLEGVEVYYHEVYCRYFVFLHFLGVAVEPAAAEYSSEYFGVECFHAPAEYGGVCGKFFYFGALVSEAFYE